jgi:hypothetical protein
MLVGAKATGLQYPISVETVHADHFASNQQPSF